MKNTFKAGISLLFILIGFLHSAAQNTGKIIGTLKDAKTAENIPFATVSLFNDKTNLLIKNTQTDALGAFALTDLTMGVYQIKAGYIGYNTIIKDSLLLSAENTNINVGNIKMSLSENNLLREVTITAEKNKDQISIGKKKFLVEQSLVSKGGTATDLLQNIPTISIDGNGSVNLRGSSKVNILIDGKPSLIAGGDVTQILQSIPAGSIESIELITNPSAKYDAEGATGIINLILKKNQKLGFNGSASASAGTRNNYTGGINLSFENNKLNVYTNYDYQRSNVFSNGYQNITYLNPGNVIFSDESFPSVTLTNANNIKLGIDYYINPKSLLSFSGGYNSSNINKSEFLDIKQYDADRMPLQLIYNDNTTAAKGDTYNVNLDFIKTFKKPKEELSFSIGYAHGSGVSDQNFISNIYNLNRPANSYDLIKIHPFNHNLNRYYNVQVDYTLPIGKGNLNAGYRSQIRFDERNQNVYSFDKTVNTYTEYYPYSAYFNSHNQIHALYIDYKSQLKDFSYLVGLRGEYANLNGFVNGYTNNSEPLSTPVKVLNKRLYPSITLTQKLKNNQQLQLSYACRVTRPTPRNYSPIPDISDPVNYDVGNPNILPEDIHAFELGYNKNWDKINFTSSIYYRITNNFIAHVESEPENGIITTTSTNITHAYTEGLEIISRFNVAKTWNFLVNANLYENETNAAPQFNISKSSGFSWNANITNNFSVVKNISFQIRSNYQAPYKTAQDQNDGSFGIDAGGKINLFQNKATLSLSGRDIFATRKWSFLRDGNGVLLDFERKTIGARANLSFTYNFGKDIFHAKKIEHSTEKQEN
ncbi:TonB-dependent receptor domain-containing protein [Pedobacter nototheniae]|uniref:TonB-dependent receptor domain-containing protein n=1 Tax=Pedobacter nototheniae TaxID=2488994 RepID=UPI00292CF5EB|nr:TonB-dependent receptor [Pedobacter nototheniae]